MDSQLRMYNMMRHLLRQKSKVPSVLSLSYTNDVRGDTLKYQDSLPKFPVPPLQQTLEKYLRQYRPHVSLEEYQRTRKVVMKFGAPGGKGELLQKKLEQRKDQTENWCSEWWTNHYLEMRQPNVLCSAPCTQLYRQGLSGVDEQLQLSAKVLASLAAGVSSLAKHQFPPTKVMGTPVCMDQHYKSICSCRIPDRPIDKIFYKRIDQPNSYRHAIIMRNNHFFKVDLLNSDKDSVGAGDILQYLKHIVNETKEPGIPIGLLTSQDRNTWADVYSKMAQDEVNARSFHDIQSSILVFCLDHTETFSDEETKDQYDCRWALCGGGSKHNSGNRWFDKGYVICVGTHGEAGLYSDHTVADGTLAYVLVDEGLKYMNNVGTVTTDACTPNLPPPQKLDFVVNDFVIQAVEAAGRHIDECLSYYQIGEKTFNYFGKELLKSHHISHDGFIQVAIQLTYWRMFGFLPVMFEASSLQLFKLGRMEHLRTVTDESVDFIKTFTERDVKSSDKLAKLQKALETHKKSNKEAKFGQGMERHLFGLQKIAEENRIDANEFFGDPSWERSNHVHIKTANIPGSMIRCTISPRRYQPQSFSMWYSIREDYLQFSINTTEDKANLDVNSFLEGLSSSLIEMKDLVETEMGKPS